eukprot:gnl/TRDRNA2_/TRDRNA2_69622_c0_seq1.p1 gnl/TRDRNA2_/TRDRNA2_69622_c0~~gnl/TRDRNA2_/TRDRNA2_69622_c0_seq1.p1  ORF type:complete len:175 (+),score=20.63 gnl/TRDRNA2_/TRDRNA2_69622_c0_seq1:192-716(+)
MARNFDRGAPSPVILGKGAQEGKGSSWKCSCGHSNDSAWSHCEKCGLLREDERKLRMQERAGKGSVGKGGGFFERNVEDRSKASTESQKKGGIDDFGRRIGTEGGSSSKADRQREALERLRQKATQRGKGTSSPPRVCGRVLRDNSRSRSREERERRAIKEKQSQRYGPSGGWS